MIKSYKELKFYLYADAKMSRLRDPSYTFVYRLCHKNYREKYLRVLRITEWLHNCRDMRSHFWMWFAYVLYSRRLDKLSAICGYDIPINCIGYGVNLAHVGSVVINPAASIGNYCAIMNNVVIADSNPKVIEDGVLIGSNVVILKKTDIAAGSKVAAHSLLNKSIRFPNSVWGGVPAKEIKCNESRWYENDEIVKGLYEECEIMRLKIGII